MIRGKPCAPVRIDRQGVQRHRALRSFEVNDEIGFAVSKARDLARPTGDPDTGLLIGTNETRGADDRIDMDVVDDAPAPYAKQMVLVGRGACHYPNFAVA